MEIGDPLGQGDDIRAVREVPGAVPVFPINPDGEELIWGLTGPSLRDALDGGYVRVTPGNDQQPFTIAYLSQPNIKKAERGEYIVGGRRPDGSKIVLRPGGKPERATTVWSEARHDAGAYGTSMLRSLLPGRSFPFPKSLYAVEDSLRHCIGDNKVAVVLDFFAGSGTTAHAVSRLNRQDDGRRHSISVTNNEVSVDEAKALRSRGLLPGDPEWEELGIFEYITRPRITAAVTGKTPDGEPVKGGYKFTDEFPMAEGFEESVEFLELTYLDVEDVELDLAFESVAPLLWLRAGSRGPVIDDRCDGSGQAKPHDMTTEYGVLFNPDHWRSFVDGLPESVATVFIVTDSASVFASIAAELSSGIDVVRLYENYLTTFAISQRR